MYYLAIFRISQGFVTESANGDDLSYVEPLKEDLSDACIADSFVCFRRPFDEVATVFKAFNANNPSPEQLDALLTYIRKHTVNVRKEEAQSVLYDLMDVYENHGGTY